MHADGNRVQFRRADVEIYYVRAIEIPTPRQSLYDDVALGIDPTNVHLGPTHPAARGVAGSAASAIRVGDFPSLDTYSVTVSDPDGPSAFTVGPPEKFFIGLNDNAATANSSVALPLEPPDIADFQSTLISFTFVRGTSGEFTLAADLLSLSLVSPDEGPVTVPEPSHLALSACLALLIPLRRRGRPV